MREDLLKELRKMGKRHQSNHNLVNNEEKNPTYSQTPNFSPSPLKSRVSRLSRRSRGDKTPETRISKSQLDCEMKIMQDKIMEKSKLLVSSETSRLKDEVGEFMMEVMKEIKTFKERNSGGGDHHEEFSAIFTEINDLRNDNHQVMHHLKAFNGRVEKMEMRLFNYEMDLSNLKAAKKNNQAGPNLDSVVDLFKERDSKIESLARGLAGFCDKIEGFEDKINKLGEDLILVSQKEEKDIKSLTEFTIEKQKEILLRLENKISELAYSSKFKESGEAATPEQPVINDQQIFEVLQKEENQQIVATILLKYASIIQQINPPPVRETQPIQSAQPAANTKDLDAKFEALGAKLMTLEEALHTKLNKNLEQRVSEVTKYIDSEIDRVSKVVDTMEDDLNFKSNSSSNKANYCSLSKFALREELNHLATTVQQVTEGWKQLKDKQDALAQQQQEIAKSAPLEPQSASDAPKTSALIEDRLVEMKTKILDDINLLLDAKIDEKEASRTKIFEEVTEEMMKQIEKKLDSKLDKNEADLFQNEFERIVKRIEELSLKIDTNLKHMNQFEASLYKTKEAQRSPKRRGATSAGISYQLSPDEAHSRDFTDDKLNYRMVDFTKQNGPSAVSVQSDQDHRSLNQHTQNPINSSRENNFNSLEKTLKFNIENSKSKRGSKEKSVKSKTSVPKHRPGVEEVNISYVLSNHKQKKIQEEDEISDGPVSRRLFGRKDHSSIDSAVGGVVVSKNQTFLSTLNEITAKSKLGTLNSDRSTDGHQRMASDPRSDLEDKENIRNENNQIMGSSAGGVQGQLKKIRGLGKVIEPDGGIDFEKWMNENNLLGEFDFNSVNKSTDGRKDSSSPLG